MSLRWYATKLLASRRESTGVLRCSQDTLVARIEAMLFDDCRGRAREMTLLGHPPIGFLISCGPNHCSAHAGESETSIMMSMEGRLVKPDRFERGYLGPFGPEKFNEMLKHGIGILSENGVLGDPALADTEHGKVYLSALIENIADAVSRSLI